MASVKSCKNSIPSVFLSQILFLSISICSFSQTKQTYRNHEEIDVGGGMKVEILKCVGEGPTEECDCIYFTDKRQNGMRMKQNANRLKEEARAAELAKGINKPETRKTTRGLASSATDHRADKTIPEVIKPRPNAPGSKPAVSLDDAAKRADSIAQANSAKLKESLSKATPTDDSTEMDKVYIPKVTETGGARLEASVPKVTPDNTTTSGDQRISAKEIPGEITNNPASPSASNVSNSTTAAAPIDTTANANSAVQHRAPINTTSTAERTPNNIPVNAAPSKAPATSISANTATKVPEANKDTAPAPVGTGITPNAAAKSTGAVKDTEAVITSASELALAIDSAETGWVKRYDQVKTKSDTIGQVVTAPATNQDNKVDSSVKINDGEALKATLKAETETTGSGVMESPVLNGKGIKNKEQKAKKQTAKAAKAPENQNKLSSSKNTSPVNPGLAVNNTSPASTKSKEGVPSSITAPGDSLPAPSLATSNLQETKVAEKYHEADENNNSKISSVNNASSPSSKVNVVGRTAEVKSKGLWEKATIIDKETEFLYKVHYKGTGADQDEWVAVTQIRNIDSSAHPVNTPGTDKPAKSAKVNVNCSFEAPTPRVLNSDKFSEKLAKRKIYDNYMAEKKGNSQVKTGVTFLSVKAEEPYVNTVTISATNNLEVKLSLAPSGAMIYPVEAEYKVCEQVMGKTTSKTMNGSYACFRNKSGEWTCAKLE